ncbi:hypothetical protein GUJ93_ZPchr0010g7575 [Zizania palustris]|uniref:Uncharacterized protein n=1 Tax=Zizania palustris TaxID=103762 RepID=A0A8J5WGA3_ZIZPA|nr:hypothetical protein GUJ93_ZPchr0010g7575 [Zizania palustris]
MLVEFFQSAKRLLERHRLDVVELFGQTTIGYNLSGMVSRSFFTMVALSSVEPRLAYLAAILLILPV